MNSTYVLPPLAVPSLQVHGLFGAECGRHIQVLFPERQTRDTGEHSPLETHAPHLTRHTQSVRACVHVHVCACVCACVCVCAHFAQLY